MDVDLDGNLKDYGWWPPHEVSRSEMEACRAVVEAGGIVPAPRQWIAGRVATLLGHYHLSEKSETMVKHMAQDWLRILEPYPQGAIETACDEYLKTGTYPPKPADIVAACKKICGEELETMRRAKAIVESASIRQEARPAEHMEYTRPKKTQHQKDTVSVLADMAKRALAGEDVSEELESMKAVMNGED